MGDKTGISWTDRTWNPWRGCTKVSTGCANCYMFTEQRRYGQDPTQVVRCGRDIWRRPYRWEREAAAVGRQDLVFTCSWSDWFHPDADDLRDEAWDVIRSTPHITYQVLTKRPKRIADHLPPDWGDGWPNVWLGVSIESASYVSRADELRTIPAAVRFISYEPALGPIDHAIDLRGIHWLIYGGESGPGWRADDPNWARGVRDRCAQEGVAFYFKQRAGPRPETITTLDGAKYREMPTGWAVAAAETSR